MTKDLYDPSIPTSRGDADAAAAARKPANNIVQGTSAAGVRAVGTQLVAFYFRAPVKAFFRMRVDYMVGCGLFLLFYLYHDYGWRDGEIEMANEGESEGKHSKWCAPSTR